MVSPTAHLLSVFGNHQGKRNRPARLTMTGKVIDRDRVLRRVWWLFATIVFVLVIAIRIRLLGIPLERDEGEYAYAGQLMLQGIPPYKLAYNMKLPGIYAAY